MKRSKKSFLIVVCLVFASLSVLGFAACNKESHSHDYAELKYNEFSHWLECDCGEKSTLEFHRGGTATCGKQAKCEICNQDYGAIKEHDYLVLEYIPTCTEQGYTTYTCMDCDYSYADDYVSATGHLEVFDKSVEATCTASGLTEGKHCSVCDEVLVAQTVVPALGHTEVVDSAVAPTCTETGLTEGKHCAVCKEVLVAQQIVDALGHTEVIDQAVAPDCVNTGLTQGKHCSVCNEVLVAQSVVNALGHTEVIDSAVAPTCTVTGLTEGKHCSVCNEVLVEQTVVSALGHTEVKDNAVAPTCTATGLTEGKHCSVCNEVLVAQTVVDALGHTEVIDSAVVPTCTATGLTEGKHCLVCNEVLVKQEVLPVAHVYEDSNQCSVCEYISTECFTFTLLSDDTYEIKAKDVNNIPANIVIPSSYEGKPVTSIGSEAFRYCSSLTSVEIPDSVTSIGSYAFNGCSGLLEMTLPFIGASKDGTSNTHFGYIFGARDCWHNNSYVSSSLKKITLTGGSSIDSYAFYNCDDLTSIEIPNSVTSIGNQAFYGCTSLTYNIDSNIKYLGNSTNLYLAAIGTTSANFSSYSISSLAKIIAGGAFADCTRLSNIVIHDGIISIGNQAFSGCTSLASVEIGNSVTSIGYEAFYDCSGLTEVNYLGTIDNWAQIEFSGSFANPLYYTKQLRINGEVVTEVKLTTATKISNYAFSSCSSLTSVVIPDSVTSIGDRAFYGCYNLTSVVIGDSVTSIGSSAFSSCSSLTSIVIPDSVTSIGSGAFGGCSSLQSITIPFVGDKAGKTSSDTYQYPFGYIFGTSSYTGGTATKQYYYGSSTSITTYSTYYIPTSLKQVMVTGGNILYGAFYNCSNLTSIEIPDSVTSIGDSAFYKCSDLTSIAIGNSVTSIGSGAFGGCYNLTSVVIGDSVTSIGSSAFSSCSSLTSIVIPDSVTSIGTYAFCDCSSLTSVEIPNSVTSIGSYAFCDCSSLTSVEIPNSVTSIGDRAFYGCDSLTSVVIGVFVTSIGDYAFYGCDSLTSVVIGNSVTSIGSYAFRYCYKLVEVINKSRYITITKGSSSNGYVGCYALSVSNRDNTYVSKITNDNGYIIYTDGAEKILVGYNGTETDLVLPSYITKIYKQAFEYCDNLTSVEIPDSVTSIGAWAFNGCSSLTSAVIGNSVTSIGSSAFYGCDKLVEVINKSSHITATKGSSSNGEVGHYALSVSNCDSTYVSKLTNDNGYIIYTDGAEKILVGYNGTETDLVLPSYITKIYQYAFYRCSSLTSIEIPNSVTSIGTYAFCDCSSLTSVVIPDSVTSIGTYAFYNCRSLTSVVIGDSVTSIGTYVFCDCSSLTSVVIPDSVTSIGDRAFWACSSLTSVEIPNSVTSIGSFAFYNCSSLTSVVIPNSVTSIGASAFDGCRKLVEVINKSRHITITKGSSSNGYVGYYALSVSNCDNTYVSKITNDNGYIIYTDGAEKVLVGYTGTETALTLPSYITKIYQYAFYYCDNLTSVVIPDSVTSIGDSAFAYCDSLTSIKYRGTQSQWNAISKGDYWNSYIGDYTITYNYTGE